MKRPASDVSLSKSIKELIGGKFTLQNEILGTFARTAPEKGEELPLEELSTALGVGFSGNLDKYTIGLVSRLVCWEDARRFQSQRLQVPPFEELGPRASTCGRRSPPLYLHGGLAVTTTLPSPQSRPSRPPASCPPFVNPSSGAIRLSQPDFGGFSFPLFVNPSSGAIHRCQPDFGGLAVTTTLASSQPRPSRPPISRPVIGIHHHHLNPMTNFVNPSSGANQLGQQDLRGLAANDTVQECRSHSLRIQALSPCSPRRSQELRNPQVHGWNQRSSGRTRLQSHQCSHVTTPTSEKGDAAFTSSVEDRQWAYIPNTLAVRKSKSLLQLMWLVLKDKVLVSLRSFQCIIIFTTNTCFFLDPLVRRGRCLLCSRFLPGLPSGRLG